MDWGVKLNTGLRLEPRLGVWIALPISPLPCLRVLDRDISIYFTCAVNEIK
jgi:hypothetical protein